MQAPSRLPRPERHFRRVSSFEIAVAEWWNNGWCAMALALVATSLAGIASAAAAWFFEYPRHQSAFTVLSIAFSAGFMTWVSVLVYMAICRMRGRG